LYEFGLAFFGQFSANWLVWGLAISYFFARVRGYYEGESAYLIFSVSWIFTGILAVLVSMLYWPHYFLQFNPAICLLAAMTLNMVLTELSKVSIRLSALTLFFLVFGGFYNEIRDTTKDFINTVYGRYYNDIEYYGDLPRTIASEIEEKIGSGELIFVADYNPIIYSLLEAKLPTKYVFPPHLIGSTSSRMLPVSADNELTDILKKDLKAVVRKRDRPDPSGTKDIFYESLNLHLDENFEIYKTIEGIEIYFQK
jgi:hypothetical protein